MFFSNRRGLTARAGRIYSLSKRLMIAIMDLLLPSPEEAVKTKLFKIKKRGT